jgi:NodT family efflux transporter outer membrane factor (OMF) lipoprotein
MMVLLAGVARAQPKPVVSAPPAFSQGVAGDASHLEALAWWEAFGDPTLTGLVRRATGGSLTLQQAQARILQARAALGSAKADQWPSVTATAQASRSRTSTNAVTPTGAAGAATLFQAGFDTSWELDLFGGKRKAWEAAQARYEASVEDLRATLLSLAGDVASNYITLRGNQALLEVTRQNAETQRQAVNITEERQRLGLTSGLDAAQARAQLAATEAELPALEASIRQSSHRLGVLLGLEPTALVAELSQTKPLPAAQGAVAIGLPLELLARRPDLRSAERNLNAALADVGVARADLYPKFDLTLGLGLQSAGASTFTSISSRYWSIVPGLSLPVFNRGAIKANLAKKEGVYQEALAGFQASYHSALEDVENALANYYAERARAAGLAEALSQSRLALALAQERYRRGLTSFLDVLTAQSSVHTAQRSLTQSQAQILTDLVALHKALGGGWAVSGLSA